MRGPTVVPVARGLDSGESAVVGALRRLYHLN